MRTYASPVEMDVIVDFINQAIPKLLEFNLLFIQSQYQYDASMIELTILDTITGEYLTFYVSDNRIVEWSNASNARASEYFVDLVIQDMLLDTDTTSPFEFSPEELNGLLDESYDIGLPCDVNWFMNLYEDSDGCLFAY